MFELLETEPCFFRCPLLRREVLELLCDVAIHENVLLLLWIVSGQILLKFILPSEKTSIALTVKTSKVFVI